MAELNQRRRRAIAAGLGIAIALVATGAVVGSPRARASFGAAYRAFRDPSLVAGSRQDPGEAAPPAAVELEQPDIAGDFDHLDVEGMADAGDGTVASLTWPDLPIPISKRTMRFVAYFAESEKGRQAFIERYRRGGRYRGHIERALRDADLPEDLIWLLAIESGFNPQAISPKGAAGLFQFMPETAARYGLAQSDYLDERRSITKSSAAGVSYLRDLFARYGAWDLALAAYNFGEDRLDEAIDKLKARRSKRDADKPIELKDLAEARLVPKETANFVPQIQAFAIVAANRGRFRLDDLDPVEPFEIGEVAVPAGTEVRTIAKAAGVSVEVIRDYNPDLLRPELPPSGSDLLVNIPAANVARALAAFPLLFARAAASASASAASAAASVATPPPSASASAAPTASAVARASGDRITIPNGIAVICEGPPASEVKIAATIELLAPTRAGTRSSGPTKSVDEVRVPPGDLERGLDRIAASLRGLVLGDAGADLRRLASAGRRADLERAPYGSAWVALSDRLFPAAHPLAGTTLAAPLLPLVSVVIAEPPPAGAMKITVQVTGAEAKTTLAPAGRALAGVLDLGPAAPPFPREDRISLNEKVPSPRVVFGWIGPPGDDRSSPALRLGLLLLAHDRFGRLAHTLVADKHVAVHVRGSLENFGRGSAIAIEATPSVKYDVAAVVEELDRALAAFIAEGPSAAELTEAKAQLRARLEAERGRAGSPDEPKDRALARIARTAAGADAATGEEVQAVVKQVLAKDHRVVVTTVPTQ